MKNLAQVICEYAGETYKFANTEVGAVTLYGYRKESILGGACFNYFRSEKARAQHLKKDFDYSNPQLKERFSLFEAERIEIDGKLFRMQLTSADSEVTSG